MGNDCMLVCSVVEPAALPVSFCDDDAIDIIAMMGAMGSVCGSVCTHTPSHTYTHSLTHIHTLTHTHAHTHTHTCTQREEERVVCAAYLTNVCTSFHLVVDISDVG